MQSSHPSSFSYRDYYEVLDQVLTRLKSLDSKTLIQIDTRYAILGDLIKTIEEVRDTEKHS